MDATVSHRFTAVGLLVWWRASGASEGWFARLAEIVRDHPGMWPTFSFRLNAEGQFRPVLVNIQGLFEFRPGSIDVSIQQPLVLRGAMSEQQVLGKRWAGAASDPSLLLVGRIPVDDSDPSRASEP